MRSPVLSAAGALLTLCLVLWLPVKAMAQSDADAWAEGAAAYKQALADYKTTGKPMLVYFYAPWCGYCRKFSATMLTRPEIKTFLKSYSKVKIYPESGIEEGWLAQKLGVAGYPEMYVWYANPSKHGAVTTYNPNPDDPDGWAMVTPQEFMNNIRDAH